jgi:hypothetical protein
LRHGVSYVVNNYAPTATAAAEVTATTTTTTTNNNNSIHYLYWSVYQQQSVYDRQILKNVYIKQKSVNMI